MNDPTTWLDLPQAGRFSASNAAGHKANPETHGGNMRTEDHRLPP